MPFGKAAEHVKEVSVRRGVRSPYEDGHNWRVPRRSGRVLSPVPVLLTGDPETADDGEGSVVSAIDPAVLGQLESKLLKQMQQLVSDDFDRVFERLAA